MRSGGRTAIRLVGVLGATLLAAPAFASPEPTDAERRAAQASFHDGQRAFKAGDYAQAAEKFEDAYRRAPHHAPLWNAGKAWQRAGDLTRAANAYAKYLREAPANAPDRNNALSALKELKPKLGRIEVHATGISDVTLDGDAFEGDGLYVLPGTHVVEGKTVAPPHELVRLSPAVAAGEMVSVALVPPAVGASSTPAATRPTEVSSAQRERSTGVSPTFAIVGGAVTLAIGGLSVWSGLDVNAQKQDYLAGPQTQERYDAGKSAEQRTNILLGVTGGLAVLTAITAVFLVSWQKPRRDGSSVRAGVAPGYVSLIGVLP